MADPWTAEDVERVGWVIAEHRIDCDPASPCIVCSESALAVLAALAEAGRLREPDADTNYAAMLTEVAGIHRRITQKMAEMSEILVKLAQAVELRTGPRQPVPAEVKP